MTTINILKIMAAATLGACLYCCAPHPTYERRVTQTQTQTVTVEERGERPALELPR